MTRQAFIFANGDRNDGAMPRRALAAATPEALYIAADGGARVAREFGVRPHIVIGDLDSITQGDLAALEQVGVEIRRYSVDKDETDLELALMLAAERGAQWIRILGGIGDRLDQTLANVQLMGASYLADCDVRLVGGRQAAWLIGPGEHAIEGAPGDTVSLLPMTGTVTEVRTGGLRYPLHGETLAYGQARGISNVLAADHASIALGAGMLLVVHTVGRA